MSRLQRWVFVCLLAALGVTSGAFAKTPDGKTPAEETVCDNEHGAAFGICNAYCEALDCSDPNQRASNRACEELAAKFQRMTGRPVPCSTTCPCAQLITLFGDINSGAVKVQECTIYPNLIYVQLDDGQYATVGEGEAAACSANGQPPYVQLTGTESLVCRIALRKAVEAQGVSCRSPE